MSSLMIMWVFDKYIKLEQIQNKLLIQAHTSHPPRDPSVWFFILGNGTANILLFMPQIL